MEHHRFQLRYVVELAIPRPVSGVFNLEVPSLQLSRGELVTLINPPANCKLFDLTRPTSNVDISFEHLFIEPCIFETHAGVLHPNWQVVSHINLKVFKKLSKHISLSKTNLKSCLPSRHKLVASHLDPNNQWSCREWIWQWQDLTIYIKGVCAPVVAAREKALQ